MEWWVAFLLVLGSLILIMMTGLPVAFCFMLVSLVGAFVLWRGEIGLVQFISSTFESISSFTLLPLPMFVLMGEVMFHSGVAPNMIDTLDKWLGRLPGRLSLLTIGGGTLFSVLSGSTMASIAMLGSTLLPEMEKRGYKKPMSLGPILGSGGLAMMIPPSNMAVIMAAIAEISIGKILIAIVIPGLLMAVLYTIYTVGRCWLQPDIAPPYVVSSISLVEKLKDTVRYILPVGFIVLLVIGLMFLGIATPTESAAAGAIGCFILAAAYKQLNWAVVKKSIGNTVQITVMSLMIMATAKTFSQILVFTGATQGLVRFALGMDLAPILVMITMQIVLIILGMFIGSIAIMMITLPIFMPVIYALGFDPIWFGVIFLLNMEMGQTTPPYGMGLFVMKGVVSPDVTMGDIWRAALPYLYCDAISMALIIAFPKIALLLV